MALTIAARSLAYLTWKTIAMRNMLLQRFARLNHQRNKGRSVRRGTMTDIGMTRRKRRAQRTIVGHCCRRTW
jgi:hypothetical protein